MQAMWRTIIKGVGWIGLGMVVVVVFHLGGTVALRVGQFSPLTGAFIGGTMVLTSVLSPIRRGENAEPWIGPGNSYVGPGGNKLALLCRNGRESISFNGRHWLFHVSAAHVYRLTFAAFL